MGRFNQEFMFVYRMYVCIHDAMMHFFGSHIWCKPQSNLIVHIVSSWGTNVIALPNRSQNFDSDIVLLPCFCCASAVLLSNRSTTYELCLNLHILFFCSAPWLVTLWHPIVLLLPPLLWLAFWRMSVWNAHHGSLLRFLVTHFMHILGRLLVVLLIARRSWSSFIQGNDWFCLIDACCFIDRSLIVEQFCAGKWLVLFDWYF